MTPIPAGWKPIESAPKTGRTLLLGYWNSHGKWRTVRGQWMSAEYIGQEWDEPDGVEAGWFETAVEADDVPNCWPVIPSHWQPMPEPPCLTCGGHGMVGGLTPHSGYDAQPCPNCSPTSSAPGDAQDEHQAFEAQPYGWLYDWTHSSATGRPDEHFTSFTKDEQHAKKHDNPRAVYLSSPAAGDALDAKRYRWLREKAHQTAGRAPAAVLCDESDMFQRGEAGSESGFIHGKDLDDAIDAALAAQVPQQGEA